MAALFAAIGAGIAAALAINGPGKSYKKASVAQQTLNSVFQNTSSSCVAESKCVASGNTVILSGSAGSAGIELSCSSSAACAMNNSMDASVKNIQTSLANQKRRAVNGAMGDLGTSDKIDSVDMRNSITNYITQITQSTCQSRVAMQANNNLIYATPSSKTSGFTGIRVGVQPPSNANASCTMVNVSKIDIYNKNQADTDQSESNIGSITIIAIILIVTIAIVAIIFIIISSGPEQPAQPQVPTCPAGYNLVVPGGSAAPYCMLQKTPTAPKPPTQ